MSIKFILVVLLSFGFLASGCATIIHGGTTQDVSVNSVPTAASVTVDGETKGKTPAMIDLKRKNSHKITIAMEGYQPYEIATTKKVSGWVWGNILFGGLIGLAVDAISGGLYNIEPEIIQAQLIKSETNISSTTQGIDTIVKEAIIKKTPAEQLEDLKKLKDQGIITEEEYQNKRKGLVDQL